MPMESTEPLAREINDEVKRQYEAYPYPDYSLFIPLRTQEAYASHSLFSGQLQKERGVIPAVRSGTDSSILIAGSGDILPFILSFWEPESRRINVIDLSERNIQRARLRSTFRPHDFQWLVANLEDQDFRIPSSLSHIDSYGVLHHLARPKEALKRLADNLVANGTMRIMVYNSEARHWIHQLQASFHLLGLSAYEARDLNSALEVIRELMRVSPRYRERLAPMKSGIFHHSSRFVDTFFHAHEGRTSLAEWLKAIDEAGLEPIGLFDRYAELDDLPNPLLTFPSLSELNERIGDRRFENNFELFIAKKSGTAPYSDHKQKQPSKWMFKTPPTAWFTYTETNRISLPLRYKLWRAFIKTMSETEAPKIDHLANRLGPKAIQRLGRLGAIFPSQFQSEELKALIKRPMHETMDPPNFGKEATLQSELSLRRILERIAKAKERPQETVDLVLKRLEAGQGI